MGYGTFLRARTMQISGLKLESRISRAENREGRFVRVARIASRYECKESQWGDVCQSTVSSSVGYSEELIRLSRVTTRRVEKTDLAQCGRGYLCPDLYKPVRVIERALE